MGTGIRVVMTGVPELQATLNRLKNVPKQKDALAEALAQRFTERIELRYTTKTDPNGQKWSPIKPATQQSLQKRASLSGNGTIPGTLLDRHNPGMRSSLTRAKLGNDWLVGFSRKYALYHEFGTKYMDRRGLIWSDPQNGKLSPADLAALLRTADAFIRAQI